MTDAAPSDYGYDVLDRLREARAPTTTYAYAYDPVANRTSATVGTATTTYAYDAANRMTTPGAATYTYDANGNLTAISGGPTLTYNAKDQNSGYRPPGLLASNVAMAYADASQDERTQAGSTLFLTDFIGVARSGTQSLLSSSYTYYTRDPNGNLVGQRTPNAKGYYYLFDGLGSVVAVTDEAGTVVNRYTYDPYGNPVSTIEGVANALRFAGGYRDAFSGFSKFGTRYYDPAVGRWTQMDPVAGSIDDPSTVNRYVYAGDDPVNFVDPTGRRHNSAECRALTAVGGITVLAALPLIFVKPVPGLIVGAVGAYATLAWIKAGCHKAHSGEPPIKRFFD